MNIRLNELQKLLDLLIEKEIAEFEHEDEHVRLRIVRSQVLAASQGARSVVHGPPTTKEAPAPPSPPPSDIVDITSPFVGTFYSAPSPEAPPFVEVGASVRVGQTLCIVEAMKLMNEIESECAGTIVEIVAQNGKAVEYGQKLFRIRKA